MKPEVIFKRVMNPKHIDGIYNYCDRWCERCNFTRRCLIFELNTARVKNSGQLDLGYKAFRDDMNRIFELAVKLALQSLQNEDLTAGKKEMEYIENKIWNQKDAIEKAKEHSISREANAYILMTFNFFRKEERLFKQKADEKNSRLHLGWNEKEINRETQMINDSIEVINRYNPQIWVKLIRALTAKFEGEEWQDKNGLPRDSDGSAKVALIGIDRSMAAWGRLQQSVPEKTDKLISILVHLDKLRKHVEILFSSARSFQRPGFDDFLFLTNKIFKE